jgi:hypothetical protein
VAVSRHEEEGQQTFGVSPQETILPPPSSVLPSLAPPLPTHNLFRQDGEYWTIRYQGATYRLKDLRGLHHLAYLLRHPHQEFPAVELASKVTGAEGDLQPSTRILTPGEREPSTVGFSDAGEVLDSQAKAAYKRRLEELRAEVAEAREFNDLSRAEKHEEEIEFLTQELARAIGLGGRHRKAASAVERARTNITHAIKAALRKIGEHHPTLGQHLTLTTKTGVFCSYAPDPRVPLTWQV